MQKILLTIIALLCGLGAYAQDKDVSAPKDAKKKSVGSDRVVIDLFHDNWLTKPSGVETKWYGRGIGLYTMFNKNLIKKNVNIGVGIGVSSHNVYHNALIAYNPLADSTGLYAYPTRVSNLATAATEDSIDVSYKKNKISTTYIDVPLELRFMTNGDAKGRKFKIAVGGRVGYLINGHTKYKGDDLNGTGAEVKIKQGIIQGIDKLRYGATARIGYGNINLFGYYALSDMFKKDKGPEIVPFSIGFSFNGM